MTTREAEKCKHCGQAWEGERHDGVSVCVERTSTGAFWRIAHTFEPVSSSDNADEETPCPVREDGAHCEHWYDASGPCCGCGYGAHVGAFRHMLDVVGEYEQFWNGHGSPRSRDTIRADLFAAAATLRAAYESEAHS